MSYDQLRLSAVENAYKLLQRYRVTRDDGLLPIIEGLLSMANGAEPFDPLKKLVEKPGPAPQLPLPFDQGGNYVYGAPFGTQAVLPVQTLLLEDDSCDCTTFFTRGARHSTGDRL